MDCDTADLSRVENFFLLSKEAREAGSEKYVDFEEAVILGAEGRPVVTHRMPLSTALGTYNGRNKAG